MREVERLPDPVELRARPLDVVRTETSPAIFLPALLCGLLAAVSYVLVVTGGSDRLLIFGTFFAFGAVVLGVAALPDSLTLRVEPDALSLVRRTRPGGRAYGWSIPWQDIEDIRPAARWVELRLADPEGGAGSEWEMLTGGSYGRKPEDLAALLKRFRTAAG